MKFIEVVFFIVVTYCVCESGSFKLLQKVKDLLHPTTSTTTATPTVPEYESQWGQKEDESKSWEQETTASSTKSKHSDENLSTSESSEKDGGSFSNANKPYNNEKDKTKYEGSSSFGPTTYTTSTDSSYDNTFSSSKYNQVSSNDNYLGSQTTTYKYDHSKKNENYPGQSSFTNEFNKEETTSTTPTSYDYRDKNQNGSTQSTTAINYDKSQNKNNHDQSSSIDAVLDEVFSTTPTTGQVVGYQAPSHKDQASVYNGNNDTTTPRTENNDYGFNQSNQPLSSGNFVGQSPAENENSEQPSSYDNYNDRIPSTTPTYSETSYNEEQQGQNVGNNNYGGSFDSTSITPSYSNTNYNEERPEDTVGSNNNGGSFDSTSTTPTYGNTNYNEALPGQSVGNINNGGSLYSTSTTSDGLTGSSLQGGNHHEQSSGSSYSSSKTPVQAKDSLSDTMIIFPDDPVLNPTPETERDFGKDSRFQHRHGYHKAGPVPVNDENGRRVIDGPSKTCGPGEIFNTRKGACTAIARK